jgi:mannosylglycerate hydrolase
MYLTLKYDSRRVDLKIDVENNAESHRLRIMIPTLPDAKFSWGEGQFDVVKRSIKRIDSSDWVEKPMYDYPMHHFVDISNDKHGISALVDGLKEYEVLNDKKNTLAITLLRTFEYIIQPSSKQDYTHQKGSQCLGWQSFRLSVYPHSGNWEKGNVYNEALNYNNEMSIIEHGCSNGYLPTSNSLLSISNDKIIISCFKQAESKSQNKYVLRIYNPSANKQSDLISFHQKIKKVSEITIEEKLICEVNNISENQFEVDIESKKIKTYQIEFNKSKRRIKK